MNNDCIPKKDLIAYLNFKLECGYSEQENKLINQLIWVVENWKCPIIKTTGRQ